MSEYFGPIHQRLYEAARAGCEVVTLQTWEVPTLRQELDHITRNIAFAFEQSVHTGRAKIEGVRIVVCVISNGYQPRRGYKDVTPGARKPQPHKMTEQAVNDAALAFMYQFYGRMKRP